MNWKCFTAILIFNLIYTDVKSQTVNISIIVQAPYSPYLSDYLIYENRTTIILSNTSNEEIELYLKGTVEGDNGVFVQTDENYRPHLPIIIPANGVINLIGADLESYFTFENVTVEGFEINDLYYGDGLPEGNYSICLQAFDFNTEEALSMEAPVGCGNIFIQWIEPPEIILPICNELITPMEPQNLVFSWSINAGTGIRTQYLLSLSELEEGQDPNDAANAIYEPPFFETIVNSTSYLYGFADPQLEKGRTYAIRVKAFDPQDQLAYKNNGESEVCIFTYGQKISLGNPLDQIPIEIVDNNYDSIFSQLNNTTISGYLNYKFKDQESRNSNGEPFNLINAYDGMVFNQGADFINYSTDPNQNTSNQWGQFVATGVPFTTSTIINPLGDAKYVNENLVPINGSNGLENVTIQLVEYLVYKDGVNLEGPSPDYALNPGAVFLEDTTHLFNGFLTNSGSPVVGVDPNFTSDGFDFSAFLYPKRKVVATTSTGENGYYTFNFNLNKELGYLGKAKGVSRPSGVRYIEFAKGTRPIAIQDWSTVSNGGWAYSCLKIEVIHPQFCSPDIDILAAPGDDLELPTQLAYVNSYALEMKVKAQAQDALYAGLNQVLENIHCKVMRNKNSLNVVKPEILASEGQQLDTYSNLLFVEFKDVSQVISDGNGEAKVLHLAKHVKEAPYMVQLLSRDPAERERTENSIYNYAPTYIEIETDKAVNKSKEKGPFNRFFVEPVLEQTFRMKALAPEIKGRLIESSRLDLTGVPFFYVDLLNQYKNEIPSLGRSMTINGITFTFPSFNYLPDLERPRLTTGIDGRFSFKDLTVNLSDTPGSQTAAGPFRRLKFHRYGYQTIFRNFETELPYNLAYGRLLDLGEIEMLPMGKVKGRVEGEDGKSIEAYVKIADGAMYRTTQVIGWNNGPDVYTEFLAYAESGRKVPVQIKSLNSAYFDESFEVDIDINSGQTQDLGTFTLKRKKRRAKIYVYQEDGKPIKDAEVSVGNRTKVSNDLGLATFEFENNAERYLLKVIAKIGSPVQQWINIPVTKEGKAFYIKIERGQSFSGKVIDKQSKSPISGAKAIVLLSSLDGQDLYLESHSDRNGAFTLEGIPNNINLLKVTVIKEDEPMVYVGETKQFNLSTGINRIDKTFRLAKLGTWAIQKVLGFPVVLTKLQLNGANILASGYLHKLPTARGFSTDPNLKLGFENVLFKKNVEGEIEPVNPTILLQKNQVPITINNHFIALFESPPVRVSSFLFHPAFELKKVGTNTAQVIGQVNINAESFNFANEFEGKLFISQNENDKYAVVFSSASNNAMSNSNNSRRTQNEFHVFEIIDNQIADIQNYSALGFPAIGDRTKSKLKGNKIELFSNLQTNIPRCTPSNLDLIMKVILSKEEINFEHIQDQNLQFKLDDWTINGLKPLAFDEEEELIVLPEVLINTGKGIDARVVNMKLSANQLSEGNISLEGGLSLGNVVDVKLAPGSSAHFDYDEQDDIYRIYLKGRAGGNPAYVDELPGIDEKLYFQSFSIMSRGSDPMSIAQRIKLFDVLNLDVDQVLTGLNYFILTGGTSLNLPGEVLQQSQIKYTKNGNDIVHALSPLKGFVELEGNVKFKLDESQEKQNLSASDGFWANGDFIIRPHYNLSGSPIILKGKLNRSSDAARFKIIRLGDEQNGRMQKFQLGANSSYMNIEEGSCALNSNNDGYSFLKFKANTDHMEGIGERTEADGTAKNGNTFNFEISGAITGDSEKLEVSDIDLTPLGNLSLELNFSDMSLTGNLDVPQPIPFGFATLSKSQFATRFDQSGFYFAANSDITIAAFPRPIHGGIILGKGTATVEHIKLATAHFNASPEHIPAQIQSRNISGFFIGGELKLFDLGPIIIPTPLAGIPAIIEGTAGIGGFFNFGFGEGLDLSMGGYAFANIGASLNVGCEFCFDASAYADVVGRYYNENLTFSSCGTISAAFGFECPIVGGSSVESSLRNKIIYDGRLNLEFGFGSCGPSTQRSNCGH